MQLARITSVETGTTILVHFNREGDTVIFLYQSVMITRAGAAPGGLSLSASCAHMRACLCKRTTFRSQLRMKQPKH
jgi:hypothetical protein